MTSPVSLAPVDLQAAFQAARGDAVKQPQKTGDAKAARKAAEEFEAVFISQFLSAMYAGVKTDGPYGGGQGEAVFRSVMLDEYAKTVAAQGGFGLADSVMRELLRAQEAE